MRIVTLSFFILIAFSISASSEPLLVSRDALERAHTEPASQVMPMLVRNAGRKGRFDHEIRRGFNRQTVALASIKKVADYDQWFRDRLLVLLPPGSIERDTRYGRINLVAMPDDERMDRRREQHTIFMTLERLATDKAISVLGHFLGDDRYLYEPGSDYGSSTLAEYAAQALWAISGTRKFAVKHGQFDLDKWREWWVANKALYPTPTAPKNKG